MKARFIVTIYDPDTNTALDIDLHEAEMIEEAIEDCLDDVGYHPDVELMGDRVLVGRSSVIRRTFVKHRE